MLSHCSVGFCHHHCRRLFIFHLSLSRPKQRSEKKKTGECVQAWALLLTALLEIAVQCFCFCVQCQTLVSIWQPINSGQIANSVVVARLASISTSNSLAFYPKQMWPQVQLTKKRKVKKDQGTYLWCCEMLWEEEEERWGQRWWKANELNLVCCTMKKEKLILKRW